MVAGCACKGGKGSNGGAVKAAGGDTATMQELLDFFAELHDNNVKTWFDANRARYTRVREMFIGLTQQIIDGIAQFDHSVAGLTPADCMWRINRDIRFSLDKSPYKTYISAFIAPHGKKSGYAGYYFHIEPRAAEDDGTWVHQLSAGLYMPEPVILQSLRDEIFDNGAEIVQAIEEAEGFSLYDGEMLKRTPKGYPSGSEYDALLRHKHMFIMQPVDEKFLLSDDLTDRVVGKFRTAHHFVSLLNRAVQYAYEEMM